MVALQGLKPIMNCQKPLLNTNKFYTTNKKPVYLLAIILHE